MASVLDQPVAPSINLRALAPLAVGAVVLMWLNGSGRFRRNPSRRRSRRRGHRRSRR